MSVLFRNVNILDSTGADPYPGDVLVGAESSRRHRHRHR